MTVEEIEHGMSNAASVVKLVCGVGNNAARLVMLEAYDHAKTHRRFRQSVKGGKRVNWYFKHTMNLFHDYERRLRRTEENRMFCVRDMSEEQRRKYGDITDGQYYDFWVAIGVPAYNKTRPLITSMQNKYRLSLQNNGVEDADQMAWVMTAQVALELACAMYESAIKECKTNYKLPERLLRFVFEQFSLRAVADDWKRAMMFLGPETEDIKPSEIEEKNIELGITQLSEAWMNHDLLYSSTADTVEVYDEVFATRGFQKKVMREIAEVRRQTQEEYDKLNKAK